MALFVLFGSTGDLAQRKLYPALWSMWQKGQLDDTFAMLGVARKAQEDAAFRHQVAQAIGMEDNADPSWASFSQRFFYLSADLTQQASIQALRDRILTLEESFHTQGRRIFYLAIAPALFAPVVQQIRTTGLHQAPSDGFCRVVIEKPFGYDLASATDLNQTLREVFDEPQIYRIDHYLGKEMVQNTTAIRFANGLFEPLWNRHYVDNVQITVAESVGVEDRASYYEKAGALRDMVQNHLLQMLTLIAMEPPAHLQTEEIRDEKVKVLRALRSFDRGRVTREVVRGQYGPGRIGDKEVVGYRQEQGVDPASMTETFVALTFYVDNERWAGVPFYARTGKRLKEQGAQIVVTFRPLAHPLYKPRDANLAENRLVIRIQPIEGIYLEINSKQPGQEERIVPVALDYCQNCDPLVNTPQAYETLILDVLQGDPTRFTRWDEAALSWSLIDTIEEAWQAQTPFYPNYAAGSLGPAEADLLLESGGRRWWPLNTRADVDLFVRSAS
ncbi:MAG: glucose-6-phosphate dehydrogenase [Firmicutes bacterium]|nr:glucose-6-phosphate dehydrogenase [Bacillota bacterium]